jgi:prepilin-type N-terminal cleavage/methylation domain-containing protein
MRPRTSLSASFPPFRWLRGRGFTLIEVAVALTLVGIAAALAIPRIATITNESRIQRAAQALQQEVQQAFAIAGRNRNPVKLLWNSGTMQLQVTNLSGTVVYRRAGLGSESGYALTPENVTVTPQSLTVFPNGLAADSLVISLNKRGYGKTIRISRSGLVRVQ